MNHLPLRIPVLASLIALSVALGGCGTGAPQSAVTPTVTTPAATPMSEPTAALEPAAAPTPSLAALLVDGEAALTRSDFAAAEMAYRQALIIDPTAAAAQIGLAWTYAWQTGRSSDALAAAKTATELAPENAAAWVVLAHVRYGQLDAAAAMAASEQAIALEPANAAAQAALAYAYTLDLRHDEALQAAREAVKLDPRSAYAHAALALVYKATADYGRATAAAEQAVSLQPGFAQWYVDLGALYWDHLYDYAARTTFDKALKQAPGHPPALLGKSRLLTAKGQYEEAEKLIAQAAESAPAAPEPLLEWGRLYLVQADYDKATAQFEAAAAAASEDWRPRAGLADVRLWQGDCGSAAGLYQDLIASHPQAPYLRAQAGWAKRCLGDANRSLELARAALELDPYNENALLLLGLILAEQERWDEATDAYLTAERYTPVGADLHAALGNTYLNRGEPLKAEAEFTLAARLAPDSPAGPVGLCNTFWRQGEPEKMLAWCEGAAWRDAGNPDTAMLWGNALQLNGRDEEAIAWLKANTAAHPEHAASYYTLGLSYLHHGDYALAQKMLEKYAALSQADDDNLTYLINATSEGWNLREAVALALLQDESQELLGRTATWQVPSRTDLDAAGSVTPVRVLIATLKAAKNEKPEETYQAAITLLALAAYVAPRMTPPATGGVAIAATDAMGRGLFTVEVAASDIWLYLEGRLDAAGYASRIHFVQPADGVRSPELTDQLIRNTAEELTDLRELDALQPFKSQRLNQAQLDAYLAEVYDDEAREQADSEGLLLTLLGTLDSSVDIWQIDRMLASQQILGFYDSDDKIFYVVTDKAPGLTDQITVAHEYVHVLQDQHFAIGTSRSAIENDDRALAYLALVEGDASLATAHYMQTYLPALELLQTTTASTAGLNPDVLKRVPALLRDWAAFRYNQGLAFVGEVYKTGGWEAVNDLYAAPPTSTEQVLHPERYRAGEQPLEVVLPDVANILGKDWSIRDEGALGELGWRLILTELAGPAAAERAAEGWGGDRYVLLRNDTLNCRLTNCGAALLQTAWDTPQDAEDFWAAWRSGLSGRTGFKEVVTDLTGNGLTRCFRGKDAYWIVQWDGTTVTLAIGTTEDEAQKLAAAK